MAGGAAWVTGGNDSCESREVRRQAPSGSSALLSYSVVWPTCVGLLDGPKTEDLLSCYMGHD